MRAFQPVQFEPARTAQAIVNWYAGKVWSLWVLLSGMPLMALVTGGGTLVWDRTQRQPAGKVRVEGVMVIIAAETLAAGVILVVVGLHALAN
jgi:hypothetical protein